MFSYLVNKIKFTLCNQFPVSKWLLNIWHIHIWFSTCVRILLSSLQNSHEGNTCSPSLWAKTVVTDQNSQIPAIHLLESSMCIKRCTDWSSFIIVCAEALMCNHLQPRHETSKNHPDYNANPSQPHAIYIAIKHCPSSNRNTQHFDVV